MQLFSQGSVLQSHGSPVAGPYIILPALAETLFSP